MGKFGNKRARFINYHKPGIYMITMNKAPDIMAFSSVVSNNANDNPRVFVRTSPLGKIIKAGIERINNFCPYLESSRFIIMEDHIHFVLKILNYMPYDLEHYLKEWQNILTDFAKRKGLIPPDIENIFNPDFNDLFFKHSVKWKRINRYIMRNPYWFWMRFKHPDFFNRKHDVEIGGIKCSLYGNLSLLDHPFIFHVLVHMRELDQTHILEKKLSEWEYIIRNGGVIVGAFRNKEEKKARDLAFETGGKVILIFDRGFAQREKPSEIYLEQCLKGNLLIISPDIEAYLGEEKGNRQMSLFLNHLAEKICNGGE